MTTPSFRDWAVILVGLRWDMSNPHLSKRKRTATAEIVLYAYILTRIEWKEKALREQLAMAERFIRLSDDGFPYPEVKP